MTIYRCAVNKTTLWALNSVMNKKLSFNKNIFIMNKTLHLIVQTPFGDKLYLKGWMYSPAFSMYTVWCQSVFWKGECAIQHSVCTPFGAKLYFESTQSIHFWAGLCAESCSVQAICYNLNIINVSRSQTKFVTLLLLV